LNKGGAKPEGHRFCKTKSENRGEIFGKKPLSLIT